MILDDAFKALREVSDAEVAGMDVQSAIEVRVRRRRGLLMRARRWAPLLAAALVALLVWQSVASARTVTIVAEGGGRISVDGTERSLTRESRWTKPFAVRSDDHPITLEGRGWVAELGTEATLRVADEVTLERGAVRVDGELALRAGTAIAVEGRAAIWRIEDMEMRKRTKLMAGGAGAVVIAVYVGHVTINGRSFTAPAAAIVDSQGRHTPIDFEDLSDTAGNDAATQAKRGADIAVSTGARQGDAHATGGYWDEAHKLVRFRIGGEVFDAGTGKPVDTFDVAVMPVASTFAATLKQTRSVSGAGDGHFVIDALSLGTWQVTVSASGYAPSRQTVELAAVADDPYLVVPLTGGARVTGLVVDARGEPVEGATVAVGATSKAMSDAKGAFVLKRIPEDSAFTVTATHQRYGTASLPNVRVGEGETEHLTITLSGILRVHGHVYRGENREPVAQAVVKSGDAVSATDAQGAYELFVPLEKHPSVRVVDGTTELESYPVGRGVEPITWVTAKTHVADLLKDFQLAMESGRITGRISEADGSPVAGASIEIKNTMGWGANRPHETFPASTTTDADGRYRVDNVPAHAGYQLALLRNSTATILGVVTINEPAEVDGSFTLASNVLRGRFVDTKTNAPFPLGGRGCDHIGASKTGESAVHAAKCFDDGTFEIEGLTAGHYRVVHSGSFVDSMQVGDAETDVPGDPIDVAITGDQARVWTVRVTSSDGAFVAEPLLRYINGHTLITSTLQVSDDGTATFSVAASQASVFVDAPGYASASLDLAGRSSGSVIDLKLARAR